MLQHRKNRVFVPTSDCQKTSLLYAGGSALKIGSRLGCRPQVVLTHSTNGRGRGCNKFVPVLGGNGTKIVPTGDIFDQASGQMR